MTGEPGLSYKVQHDYTILGCDLAAGTLDMVVRWDSDGGHCPLHRHTAAPMILVLEGEQHLWDVHSDGSRGEERIRRAGDYALSSGDEHPHLEQGGNDGGMVFFANHFDDGRLYELVDEDEKVIFEVTMQSLVEDFEANTEPTGQHFDPQLREPEADTDSRVG